MTNSYAKSFFFAPSISPKARLLTDGNGLSLLIDPGQIFPKDPGMGTPALVILERGAQHLTGRGTVGKTTTNETGTYNCVTDNAEIGGYDLTVEQCKWLANQQQYVDAIFNDPAWSVAA